MKYLNKKTLFILKNFVFHFGKLYYFLSIFKKYFYFHTKQISCLIKKSYTTKIPFEIQENFKNTHEQEIELIPNGSEIYVN